MDIHEATEKYEARLRSHLPVVVEADLEFKHERMAAAPFPFLRATFYRWSERWPQQCADLVGAPPVLGLGDIHVENYGTWRDAEGRLVWGINDFDEAPFLPYAADLVRLATSAALATGDKHLSVRLKEAAAAIAGGYREALERAGQPFVLAEHHGELRRMASSNLRDPDRFWDKLHALPTAPVDWYPDDAVATLVAAVPSDREKGHRSPSIRTRRAGLGSLGRPRLVALADWRGGAVAREVKAMLPSAWDWVVGGAPQASHYTQALAGSLRSPDPYTTVSGRWLVRRLAPDSIRIEMADLPADRDEECILRAMGGELANIHLGTAGAGPAILADLGCRPANWLSTAAERMAADTEDDWDHWRH